MYLIHLRIFPQNISKLNSAVFTDAEYEVNYSNQSAPQKKTFAGIHNCDNTELRLITNQNDVCTTFDNCCKNHIDSQMKINLNTSTKAFDKHRRNNPDDLKEVDVKIIGRPNGSGVETNRLDGFIDKDLSETNGIRLLRRGKTETSAGGARSDDGTRNTDTVAERIREKRDNNPHQRELGEVEDKNQQDRRSAQRDVQEETNRSQIATEKRRGGSDTKNTIVTKEEEERKDKNGERGNPGKNPYQQRRGEERETQLSDNSAEKIDRLDRVEEKNVTMEISRKLAKRHEYELEDEHGRHENREKPVTHRDRKKGERDKDGQADTARLSKNKGSRSKRTTDSTGDAEKGHSINEERKLPASNGKRKDMSTNEENHPTETRKRTASMYIGCTDYEKTISLSQCKSKVTRHDSHLHLIFQ